MSKSSQKAKLETVMSITTDWTNSRTTNLNTSWTARRKE